MAESKETKESHRIQITIAVIGAVAVILAAIIGIIPSLLRDRAATQALPTATAPATGAPTSAGRARSGVALPPGFASNIRSVMPNYGCGILLGATKEEQLRVCDPAPGLPAEWTGKIRSVDADCETSISDRIILELWTGEDYEGNTGLTRLAVNAPPPADRARSDFQRKRLDSPAPCARPERKSFKICNPVLRS